MALPGIANENEFYSAHYLDAILKEDLKDVAKRWKAAAAAEDDGSDDDDSTAGKSPDQALGSLRRQYFSLQDRMVRADGVEKLALQRDFFQQLLPILGYTWQPQEKALDNDTLPPSVRRRGGERWVDAPGGPRYRKIVYEAPFDKCDRVSDYRTAWKYFENLTH
jgi:hypothetical protein